MDVPVFEEYEPAGDCDCAGCAQQRRGLAARPHPSAHGCRRALVLVTAAGVMFGGGGAGTAAAAGSVPGTERAAPVLDPEPSTEQGAAGPLHGPSGQPDIDQSALRRSTRAQIIKRAKKWVRAEVPYSMSKYWTDGYRQDCSGYVSMAWNLATNEWTGSLAEFGDRIPREDLRPGDILLFHNPADPTKGSHVTIFGGWTDYTHTSYVAYEQTKPHTRMQATPMAYWNHSARYVAYRYKGVVTSAGRRGESSVTRYPGTALFGPGAANKHVTRLGELLMARGGKRFYAKGAGPRWSDADRRATRAFQLAQGWRSAEADGLPGPDTWQLLVKGKGKDIPAAVTGGSTAQPPGFPGRDHFRPGRAGDHITRLGRQLVERGYGRYYTSARSALSARWSEEDRLAVQAFQRAQGWRGRAADGYPGPETWRRLFAAR
ncbi:peptidoglycan-binding protein [Streptomyces sp. ISL-10]|uniref:peptidoglycan-binding protein n=1 Tax=Streptomyces sp. ISL-10 TaxID=2819172 RepID=UPI001BE51FB0|nr:peptidoglycan-binding protein [Streptomyces sp. ISL-10]MBT2367034.1 peptidoglycan-binding protein [Streptomyces sp. ISL-10]